MLTFLALTLCFSEKKTFSFCIKDRITVASSNPSFRKLLFVFCHFHQLYTKLGCRHTVCQLNAKETGLNHTDGASGTDHVDS
jgi:hypothetical protein